MHILEIQILPTVQLLHAKSLIQAALVHLLDLVLQFLMKGFLQQELMLQDMTTPSALAVQMGPIHKQWTTGE